MTINSPGTRRTRTILKIIGGAIAGAIALGLLVSAMSPTPSAPASRSTSAVAPSTHAIQPAPTVAAEQPVQLTTGTIPSGDWLVPTEVAPGQYRSSGPSEGLIEYCQITTYDASGNLLEWKNSGKAGAPILITVSAKAATVTNSGCGTFAKIG